MAMSRPEDETKAEGGFLGRWARRKQEVQREAEQPQAAPAAPEARPPAPAEDLPLPSLDSIVPGGDVSAFFQSHVPEALRTAALRKLWVTDPEIKNFIEMADYQWDFNNPDSIPGWSSKIADVDVKRLAERLFSGGSASKDSENALDDVAAIAKDSEKSEVAEARGSLGENTEIAVESEASQAMAELGDESVIQNDAVQNTTAESSVYEVVRKRHGGALPT
jgi:Protein of unknown function (DUF3306)